MSKRLNLSGLFLIHIIYSVTHKGRDRKDDPKYKYFKPDFLFLHSIELDDGLLNNKAHN